MLHEAAPEIVHSTDFAGTNAPWGELMSTAARARGAVGCVCDSQIRACLKIIGLNFPVYYTGIRPLDPMGRERVMADDVPVRCRGVLATPATTRSPTSTGRRHPAGGAARGGRAGVREGR